jgi:hypothetical protein
MLLQSFFSKRVESSGRGIPLNIAIPKPSTNFRYFLVGKLFYRAFDFLDGTHVRRLFLRETFASHALANVRDEPRRQLARAVPFSPLCIL